VLFGQGPHNPILDGAIMRTKIGPFGLPQGDINNLYAIMIVGSRNPLFPKGLWGAAVARGTAEVGTGADRRSP
jgi:hypothetical protein